ncbi:two-component sensor histidine kinase [Lentzea sp. NBRC 105346]|uniref:sensor histidine kinase n=1 Tax=Lentzea sp. NBRC 105346 TaxID=3032205 RepID=UPI0024A0007A|nr:HAMP domain-containing sensor histidine kinase [Lentzea sp. NBRC 105346]GLZ35896.1 two-component sensor histidine kinase [Lentzea sp. NBRC 105346]
MSLKTVSLRRRVAVAVLLVLVVVLILLVFLVDFLFASQSRRDADVMLRERAQMAQQVMRRNQNPAVIARQLERGGVRVTLVTPSGESFGSGPEESTDRELSRTYADGTKITFYAGTTITSAAQVRLRRLLLLVGLGAIAITGFVLIFVVRRALAPLDAMTSLAQAIAGGHRGGRLMPSSPKTELGRVAVAFDGMLDSLEGSELRTRRFVADAAHELRTPITGVQAVAEALVQSSPDSPDRDQMSLLLVREARRAGRLVDDLLALAQLDAGLELQREQVDILALAQSEVTRTRLLAPDFDIEASGEELTITGDGQRLAQVMANLVDNARQAAGPSGRVRIVVDSRGFTVLDNGPGVPESERERIFDRLVRLDEARDRRSGGSGLGLAIARGIVRAHGGNLTCEPSYEGAVFRAQFSWP